MAEVERRHAAQAGDREHASADDEQQENISPKDQAPGPSTHREREAHGLVCV